MISTGADESNKSLKILLVLELLLKAFKWVPKTGTKLGKTVLTTPATLAPIVAPLTIVLI